MPDQNSTDTATRIDLAHRLDALLDEADALELHPGRAGAADAAAVVPLPSADPVAVLLSVAAEIREVLHRPVLTEADRMRIHDRTLDILGTRGHGGLRLPWPQLGHRGIHPAVLGGAAAAVLAVVGVAALQRRGHGPGAVIQAA